MRQAYQLLAAPRKMVGLTVVGFDPGRLMTTYNAIPLHIWNSISLPDNPSNISCFEFGSSVEIDIAQLLYFDLELRLGFRTWTRTVSDVAGCFDLTDPQIPMQATAINSPKHPLLGLWDAINNADFAWVKRKVVHKRRTGAVVDADECYTRAYL